MSALHQRVEEKSKVIKMNEIMYTLNTDIISIEFFSMGAKNYQENIYFME